MTVTSPLPTERSPAYTSRLAVKVHHHGQLFMVWFCAVVWVVLFVAILNSVKKKHNLGEMLKPPHADTRTTARTLPTTPTRGAAGSLILRNCGLGEIRFDNVLVSREYYTAYSPALFVPLPLPPHPPFLLRTLPLLNGVYTLE